MKLTTCFDSETVFFSRQIHFYSNKSLESHTKKEFWQIWTKVNKVFLKSNNFGMSVHKKQHFHAQVMKRINTLPAKGIICLMPNADNEASDQCAHPCSLT